MTKRTSFLEWFFKIEHKFQIKLPNLKVKRKSWKWSELCEESIQLMVLVWIWVDDLSKFITQATTESTTTASSSSSSSSLPLASGSSRGFFNRKSSWTIWEWKQHNGIIQRIKLTGALSHTDCVYDHVDQPNINYWYVCQRWTLSIGFIHDFI